MRLVSTAFVSIMLVGDCFHLLPTKYSSVANFVFFAYIGLQLAPALFELPIVFAIIPFTFFVKVIISPYAIYICSFGYLICRPPRFRNEDRFQGCQLCERCQEVLQGSSLLLGTRLRLTHSVEWHAFYHTIDEVRQSQEDCRLCEALLTQRVPDGSNRATLPNYGTIPLAAEGSSLYVKIEARPKIEARGGLVNRDFLVHTKLTISLMSDGGSGFKQLPINELTCT